MSRTFANTRWIPVAALALSGCYPTVRQYVYSGTPAVVDIRAGEPASVLLDRDSTVKFARIRLIGDTLYGWADQDSRAPTDSVAVALRRVIAIEQNRLSIPQTVSGILAGATGVLTVGIIALLFALRADHS